MSIVDDVRNLYEERDRLKRELDELKSHCKRKMDEATAKLVLLDEENKRLTAENRGLGNELARVRGAGRR